MTELLSGYLILISRYHYQKTALKNRRTQLCIYQTVNLSKKEVMSIVKINLPIMNFNQFRFLSYKKVRTWYAGLVRPKKKEAPYDHIIQIGDPTLRTESEKVPVDLVTAPEIKFVIDKLKLVLRRYGCVGLSATQIGIPIQIFVMEFNENHAKVFTEQEQKNMEIERCPLKVVINPDIKILDYTKVVYPESCESIKGFYADVPRYRSLNLKGIDEHGNSLSQDFNGWLARIIQHEVDHIKGITYTDIMYKKTLTCSCWNVINEHGGKVELPYGPN